MSASPAAAPLSPTPWIVSRWWDLSYIVLTPLAIVPIVWVVARNWLTPEQIGLGVIAFASLGHHLPGFLRAYGERDLVDRYRTRLIVAPMLFGAIALLFTPPAWMARALGLEWTHLHGLELILLVWGTWHGLMQTYGFMRIYDLRRGENSLRDARLDHALCLTLFAGGFLMSDSRMFGVANAMWQAGLPFFNRASLLAARWVGAGAMGVVVLLYSRRLVQRRRLGQSLNWQKLLLAGVTGWFYWYCGSLSTNLLIGVAMFEIFHAVQYDAIVWIYDRRLFARAGEGLGVWRWLFRDRWSMLGLYLGMIAAYSSLRLMVGQSYGYVFTGGAEEDWRLCLMALFVASSFLHFYLDGFIWKVSEKRTQSPLVEPRQGVALYKEGVAARSHALKWGALLALVGLLLATEKSLLGGNPFEREERRAKALARLTPELPESQLIRSQEALSAGRKGEAADLAWDASRRRPGSVLTLVDAGDVLLAADDYSRAERVLREVVQLRPDDVEVLRQLGVALLGQRRHEAALETLQRVVDLEPDDASTHYLIGHAWLQAGNAAKSIVPLREAVRLDPDLGSAHGDLGNAYYALEKWPQAARSFERAARSSPDQPRFLINLGSARLQAGDLFGAEEAYRIGLKLSPLSPELNYNLGMLLVQTGRAAEGQELLDRVDGEADADPSPPSAHDSTTTNLR